MGAAGCERGEACRQAGGLAKAILTSRLSSDACRRLVAHLRDGLVLRTDEDDPLLLAAPASPGTKGAGYWLRRSACKPCRWWLDAFWSTPGEGRVLGEEAVSRVDGVDLVLLGNLNDALDVEVALDGRHVGLAHLRPGPRQCGSATASARAGRGRRAACGPASARRGTVPQVERPLVLPGRTRRP